MKIRKFELNVSEPIQGVLSNLTTIKMSDRYENEITISYTKGFIVICRLVKLLNLHKELNYSFKILIIYCSNFLKGLSYHFFHVKILIFLNIFIFSSFISSIVDQQFFSRCDPVTINLKI